MNPEKIKQKLEWAQEFLVKNFIFFLLAGALWDACHHR